MRRYIKNTLRSVGLALNACHNTIATDVPRLHEPDEKHWRIDNSKEIAMLNKLEEQLNSDICPLCGCCNNSRASERSLSL